MVMQRRHKKNSFPRALKMNHLQYYWYARRCESYSDKRNKKRIKSARATEIFRSPVDCIIPYQAHRAGSIAPRPAVFYLPHAATSVMRFMQQTYHRYPQTVMKTTPQQAAAENANYFFSEKSVRFFSILFGTSVILKLNVFLFAFSVRTFSASPFCSEIYPLDI